MLLSEIDNSIEIGSNPRLLISRTWEFALKYLAKPGNVMQTLRKLPNSIK